MKDKIFTAIVLMLAVLWGALYEYVLDDSVVEGPAAAQAARQLPSEELPKLAAE